MDNYETPEFDEYDTDEAWEFVSMTLDRYGVLTGTVCG
jgi:hypothetical protein